MKHLVSLAFVGVVLSSCSGGASTAVPNYQAGSSQAPSVHARSAVTFTLKVPVQASAALTTRKPQYISASTQSLVITLTAQSGVAVSPPQPYAINVRTCPTVSGIQTCSLMVPAAVGADTFTVATYDAAQSSMTPTTLSGSILSTASTSTTVVVNTANSFALTLNGVVHSISLALSNAAPPSGTAATLGLTVTAQDAAGNVIIGPDAYSVPISLTNSDTSGATTLSTTSITGPSTVITVAYTGAPTSANFSASAAGATAATALHSAVTRLVAAGSSNPVVVYQPNGSSFSQLFTITNGVDRPYDVAFDAAGNIYVANYGNSTVTKYGPDGSGPILTLSNGVSQPIGLAVDRTGKIYVGNFSNNTLAIFPANATNSSSPIQTITGVNVGAAGIAVDAAGNIYTATDAYFISVFSANGTLITRITDGVGSAYGIAIDAAGKIYVANLDENYVSTYTSAYALTTPYITAGMTNPLGIAVDQAGNIYVGENSFAQHHGQGNVSIYRPDGTPLTSIGGLSYATGVAVY